jgi:hypothetical protein
MWQLTRNPNLQYFNASPDGPVKRFMESISPGYTQPYFSNHYLPTAWVMSRLFFFVILEVPRIEAIMDRVRYARLARSFDYVETPQLSQNDHRLDVEPWYQYRPLWLLSIPALFAGFQMLWSDEPKNVPIYRYMAEVVSLETVLRICIEIGWRYLGLSTTGLGKVSIGNNQSKSLAGRLWAYARRVYRWPLFDGPAFYFQFGTRR